MLTADVAPERALVLGVQGLTGGVGTSCLTAALTVRASSAHRRVLAVDASPFGAGLDLLLGLDLEPGPRWSDLARLQGVPDEVALLAELPAEEGRSVLGWGRLPQRPGPQRPWDVARSLAVAADLVVCDLPALGAPSSGDWWSVCDRVVLVAGDGVDTFAAAGAVADLVPRAAGLVVRELCGAVEPESTAVALGLPLLARMGTDKHVPTAVVRGEPVGRTGSLGRCADAVLVDVVVPHWTGASA